MVCGRTIHKIAILVGVISLVLQILGYSCPGWVIVGVSLSAVSLSGSAVQGYGEIVSYTSIWYTKICIVGEDSTSCTHESFHDDMDMGYRLSATLYDLRHLDWTEVEIELTLALIFCIIGLVLAVIGLLNNPGIYPKVMTSLASAAFLISWVLILPAVMKVGLAIQDTRTAIRIYERNNGASNTEVCTPWALALSATGLIVALICCVLLLLRSCNPDEKTSATITPEPPRHEQSSKHDSNHYSYPVTISKLFMREHTEPHIAPQYNQDILPAIGSKDNAPLERPGFGLTAYPEEPRIDYDTESLPPSTPPEDTALYPSRDSSRQNTTVGNVIRVQSLHTSTGANTNRTASHQNNDGAKLVCEGKNIKGGKGDIKPTKENDISQQNNTGTDTQQTVSHQGTVDDKLVCHEKQIENDKREIAKTKENGVDKQSNPTKSIESKKQIENDKREITKTEINGNDKQLHPTKSTELKKQLENDKREITKTDENGNDKQFNPTKSIELAEQTENDKLEVTKTKENGEDKQLNPTKSIELKHDNNSKANSSLYPRQKTDLAKTSIKENERKPVIVPQPAYRDKTRKLSPYKSSPKKIPKRSGKGLEFV